MSLAILISETASTLSAPESSTRASRLACASNGSAGAEDLEPGRLGELRAHPLGELGVGVEAGAGGGAAERDLADAAERRAHSLRAEADLRRESAELLPERHRDRVHQVSAAGLDVVGELLRLCLQRRGEAVDRRQQVVVDLAERGQVHGGGEDVVGRLAHVDVVVGVRPVAGEVGDHLVGVHVRRGARPGLEGRRSGTGRRARPRRPRRPPAAIRSARSASSSSSSALTRAAAALSRPSQRITGVGIGCPETGKFSTAFIVSSPQSCEVTI